MDKKPEEEPKNGDSARQKPAGSKAKAMSHSPHKPQSRPKPKPKQPVRLENEDDDGYDPFSDYMDGNGPQKPHYERDPWA